MPTSPYPTHKKKQQPAADAFARDTPQNLEQVPQFAEWWMPTWLSQGGPNKGSSRAKTTSSTACIREPQHSSSGCEQHLPPAAAPGKMGSTQHRSANRGKQQTEVRFARRHLSPTPQFSPSLPLPVWEATAQFFPEEPPSSIHLSLQKLQLPHQTPTPGYENHCPLS